MNMKKIISVSNLTGDLWFDYVRHAIRSAGIAEENIVDDRGHQYVADFVDEATAREIDHCMYCSCINSHIQKCDYSSEGEARQMLYQLRVSLNHDLRHTGADISKLFDALFAMLD